MLRIFATFLKKGSTKNFQTRKISNNIVRSTDERVNYENKMKSFVESSLWRFFFGMRGAKKKLGKKKAPFFMDSAQTRKFFEKNLTKNFRAWVQCEHSAFDRRAC